MTVSEQDLRVDVIHKCFPEGGDSILSAFPLARQAARPTKEFL